MTPEQEKYFTDMLDKFYNQGVDHAIEITKVFLFESPELSEPLIKKLENLKNVNKGTDKGG